MACFLLAWMIQPSLKCVLRVARILKKAANFPSQAVAVSVTPLISFLRFHKHEQHDFVCRRNNLVFFPRCFNEFHVIS